MKSILGNAVMIKAYSEGFPSNGKAVPDGAMMAKIEWVKHPNTAGWGWAQFEYDTAAKSLKPVGTGSACGYTCHTRVKARDYVFTSYGVR